MLTLPSPVPATLVGSLPGTSARDAAALVAGSFGDGDGVPHLPELPARGPGGDMVGRTAGLLARVSADLAVETTPGGWRFADAPGRESRRASSWLGEDLDAFEEALAGFAGPVAVSVCGPWTLAAAIELQRGERAVRDPGAARDLAGALGLAAADLIADVRRRVPAALVELWIDEPGLNAVLRGSIPTQSGRGTYRSVDEPVAEAALAAVVAAGHSAGAEVVVHCCDARPPYALLVRTGADALSVDLLRHDRDDDDRIGELLDAGVSLVAGIVPATDSALSGDRATVAPVRDLGHRLGIPVAQLAPALLVSPTCGLAGASPAYARAVVDKVRTAARMLREEDDDRGED